MEITHDTGLLLLAGLSVIGLILLVAACKLPSFIALILASFLLGLGAGKSPSAVASSFAEGVGSVLGSTTMILALGAILGTALAESGGAKQLGLAFIDVFGGRRITLAIACAAFVIGIPVFFGAGLVLLIPVVSAAARQRRVPLAMYGLPMVAGLSVAHGLVPPHPGPIAAVGILHANLAKTLLYSVALGLPASLIAGGLFSSILARNIAQETTNLAAEKNSAEQGGSCGGLGKPIFVIFAPISLMFFATIADISLPKASALRPVLAGLGTPIIAMLFGALFALGSLRNQQGFELRGLAKITEDSLVPLGSVLLVVGAGGGFSKVLIDSGVGSVVAALATSLNISPLLLGWLLAALVRVATGSATVAITTASGLMAQVASLNPALNRELLVLSMGAGSLICSHVNDAGFWLVKEYLNLTVPQTLKTWTLLETAISVLGLLLVQLLNFLI